MDYNKIVEGILDIGEEMLKSGAENFRLEDALYRMLKSYGFVRYDVFVIPSNIQVTAKTPEGEFITQVRHIETSENDFDRLDYLNNLSRYVCAHKPDAEQLKVKFQEVISRPEQPEILRYVAGVMGGAGFAVFFGCGVIDALVAVVVSLMIVFVGKWLSTREGNLMIYNLILAFLSEIIIILATRNGIGIHPDRIMIGIVMLLISGLGTTNGFRELLQRDFISGSINILNSILGATGIALGIALAMLIFHERSAEGFMLTPSIPLQLVSCTIACIGFAMWFKVRGRQVFYSGVGAFYYMGHLRTCICH